MPPEPNPGPGPRPRGPIAENLEARRRIGRAYAEFLAVVLASVAGLSALVLWHLARRGRLIRDRLGPPRSVEWPRGLPGEDDPERTETPP